MKERYYLMLVIASMRLSSYRLKKAFKILYGDDNFNEFMDGAKELRKKLCLEHKPVGRYNCTMPMMRK